MTINTTYITLSVIFMLILIGEELSKDFSF